MITHATFPMTDKEALHLLYTLSAQAVRGQSLEHFQQVWDAYLLVVQAVYGPHTEHQLPFPCDLCRQHYAEDSLWVEEQPPEAVALFATLVGKPGLRVVWCCASCLQRWKASSAPAIQTGQEQSTDTPACNPSIEQQEEPTR